MSYLYKGGINILTSGGLYGFGTALPLDYNYDTGVGAVTIQESQYTWANGINGKALYDAQQTVTLLTLSNEYKLKFLYNGNNTSTGFRWFDSNDTQLSPYPGLPSSPGNLSTWDFYIGTFEYNGNQVISCFTICNRSGVWYCIRGDLSTAVGNSYPFITEVPEDPYATDENSEPDGGYGDFDYSGDSIGLPSLPSISIADSGFVTLYQPTLQQLQDLSDYLWAGLFDVATFKKIFADPMDCIISLGFVPVSPSATSQQELKVGNVGTGITINKLDSQFVQVSFKVKNIGLRTNGFMDFSPYTKAQIFLPYIGVRSLAIDDIARADLTLQYNIDLFTGACNASLKCEKRNKDKNNSLLSSVLYQFTGNVLANIPITAQNFSSFISSLISAVGTAVGVATGAGALAGVASAINAASSMKPDVEKSGNLSSTAGFLGVQKPYLIMTYPNLCRPASRDKTVGTPSFIGLSNDKKINAFHGFTLLHRINVKGISCTEAERQMIANALMQEGVILP